MDNNTTIQELKKKIQAFCEERDWDQFHNPKDLAIGISTESNELLDVFRFQSIEQMKELFANPSSRKHIEDELADTFFFILRFAQMNNIDLDSALDAKISKNSKRYTVENSKGKNNKIIATE